MERLFTIEETADLLRVSRQTIYRLRDGGKLEFYQAGRSVKISQASIEKYLKAITKKSTAKGFEYFSMKQFPTDGDDVEFDKQMFALY